MARRDTRNRSKRKTVSETRKVTRPVTTTKTRDITTYDKDTLSATGAEYKAYTTKGGIKSGTNPHGKGEVYGFLSETDGREYTGNTVGYSVNKGGSDWSYYDMEGRELSYSGNAKIGNKYTRYIENTEKQKYDTTEYKTETRTSSRMQAVDGRDSDKGNTQKRKLKTKREGRSKLRIGKTADKSAARMKGGPNSGRQKNKLKIDVQGAGGNTGLNIPR